MAKPQPKPKRPLKRPQKKPNATASVPTQPVASAPPPQSVLSTTTAPEVVITGFSAPGREFSRVIPYQHRNQRVISTDGRLFELTGIDAEGRRVYRDQTKF